jgi:AraC-like DNA-binding protein
MARSLCRLLDAFPASCQSQEELVTAIGAMSVVGVGLFNSSGGFRRLAREPRRPTEYALSLVCREYADEQLSLAGIARRVGISPSYLSHNLRSATGYTFPSHVNTVRVIAALPLLLDGQQQMKAIAGVVGYGSTGELDRQFKRYYGAAPTLIRELARVIILAGHTLSGIATERDLPGFTPRSRKGPVQRHYTPAPDQAPNSAAGPKRIARRQRT